MVFCAYVLILESIQIFKNRINYFLSFWNIVDLINLGLIIATVICDWTNIDEQDWVTLSSIAVCFSWLKLFYFGRMFLPTAGFIRMIVEVIKDARWFLLVFMMSVLGFANCFHVLARNHSGGGILDGKVVSTLVYSWAGSLGDFSLDGFSDPEFKDYEEIIYIVFLLFTLTTTLILLNLLIAIKTLY